LCGLIAFGVHVNNEAFEHLEPVLLSLAICLLGPGGFSLLRSSLDAGRS